MTARTNDNRIRVLIMGAGGRDFHNFNVAFRDDERYEIVCFTAAQIPGIADRSYPPVLAGPLYPGGIPIHDEAELEHLVDEYEVQQVILAYSDLSHSYVMDRASRVLASGPDFRLMGPESTMLRSRRPVIAVTAVRTGAGKSQTTRAIVRELRAMGRTVAVIRHPMPYGDLAAQAVQRFASYDDLAKHDVTIEEREEYEPHIAAGSVVYAGVDYGRILSAAEEEAEIVIWDGGNNDLPFYHSDLMFVVLDPLRPGHETEYYPGQVNLRLADVALINKIDSASREQVATVRESVAQMNPGAEILEAESIVEVADPGAIKGRRVIVVEDGPTLTHGEMPFGAGHVAAERFGAGEIIDPRPYAVGTIADTFAKYPNTGAVVPAMGYGDQQIADLQATLNGAPADAIVVGTPIDLARLLELDVPAVRVSYRLSVVGDRALAQVLSAWLSDQPT